MAGSIIQSTTPPSYEGEGAKQSSPDAAIAESGTMHGNIMHPGFHCVSSSLHTPPCEGEGVMILLDYVLMLLDYAIANPACNTLEGIMRGSSDGS